MAYLTFGTNIGNITVTAQRGEVVRISVNTPIDIPASDKPLPEDEAICVEAKEQITQYLNGEREDFLFRMNQPGSDFANAVYRELQKVPYGETISYKQLAERVNSPNAARAVGTAMKRNELPIAVPCHRVVKSDGDIGEYSAGGPRIKEQLLNIEKNNRDKEGKK